MKAFFITIGLILTLNINATESCELKVSRYNFKTVSKVFSGGCFSLRGVFQSCSSYPITQAYRKAIKTGFKKSECVKVYQKGRTGKIIHTAKAKIKCTRKAQGSKKIDSEVIMQKCQRVESCINEGEEAEKVSFSYNLYEKLNCSEVLY